MPLLEVGHIGKAHGLRGELNVRLTTDRLERVEPGAVLVTQAGRELTILRSKPHQRGFIVAFEGVASREAAEELRGSVLSALPLDDPDTLWVHDLIGSSITEVDGTARGTVVEIEANPASDLLVTSEGFLVPLTFLIEAGADGIIVDTPPGLFDRD